MPDERIDRKPDYLQGVGGPSASSPTRDEEMSMRPILTATIVGSILALVLGIIPLIGALVAGLVTGFLAKTRVGGIYASLVPATFAMIAPWLVSYLPDLPWAWADGLSDGVFTFGAIVAGSTGMLFAIFLMGNFVLCLVGGWIGGMMSERREGRDSMSKSARPF